MCKSLDDQGQGNWLYLIRCSQFLANVSKACPWLPPIRIFSASLGGSRPGGSSVDDMITTLNRKNILVIAAAGNDGGKGCGIVDYPGSNPRVLAVGAVGCDGKVSTLSSRGPVNDTKCDNISRGFLASSCDCEIVKPDIAAPGVGIVSADAFSNDGYSNHFGTSVATPHVTGVAAIYLSVPGNMLKTQEYVEGVLLNTANYPVSMGMDCPTCSISSKISFDPVILTRPNNDVGYGVVNAYRAVTK